MGFKRFVLSQGLDCFCSSAVLCVAHISSGTVPSAGESYDHSCAFVFFYIRSQLPFENCTNCDLNISLNGGGSSAWQLRIVCRWCRR